MAKILRRPRGLWLPGGKPSINTNEPMTGGLQGCWVATGENGIRDLVTGTVLAPTGTPSIVAAATGMQAKDTASNGWTLTAAASQRPTTAVSIMWMGQIYGAGVNATYYPAFIACYFNNVSGNPTYCWSLVHRATNNLYLYWNNGTAQNINATPFFNAAASAPYCIIGTVSPGNNAYIYKNGILAQSGAAASGAITYGATATIGIGIYPGNITSFANGGMSIGAMWNRALSPGECNILGNDPTRILSFPADGL
jgi:hypothetical protein